MKKLIALCCLSLLVWFCKKDCSSNNGAEAACLKAKFEQFKQEAGAVSIKKATLNGQAFYWLNTNAATWDGTEIVLNEACDTACIICGECAGPGVCFEQGIDFADAVILWKK